MQHPLTSVHYGTRWEWIDDDGENRILKSKHSVAPQRATSLTYGRFTLSGEPYQQGCGSNDSARGKPEAHVRKRTCRT